MSPRKYLGHLGLFAGLLLGAALVAPPGADAHEVQAEAQLIVVSGNGEVRVRPDSLHVDVGVETRATTLEQAHGQASRALRGVTDALRALQIPDLTMETRVVSVTPIYAPPREDRPPRIIGYTASNHVGVTIQRAPVEDLGDRAARVIDAAIASGANSVGALEFFLADPRPAEDAALAAAVANATHDAEIIARAAGVTLGTVRNVEEAQGMRLAPRSITIPMIVATPIEVEDIVVSSSVIAKFDFR